MAGKLIGYLVKPATRTIEVVQLPDGRDDPRASLHEMYRLLECSLVDVVRLSGGVSVFVDDEGLINNPQHFCRMGSYAGIIAGNMLFLGDPDDDGYSTSCPVSMDRIAMGVHCITHGDAEWSSVHELAEQEG